MTGIDKQNDDVLLGDLFPPGAYDVVQLLLEEESEGQEAEREEEKEQLENERHQLRKEEQESGQQHQQQEEHQLLSAVIDKLVQSQLSQAKLKKQQQNPHLAASPFAKDEEEEDLLEVEARERDDLPQVCCVVNICPAYYPQLAFSWLAFAVSWTCEGLTI